MGVRIKDSAINNFGKFSYSVFISCNEIPGIDLPLLHRFLSCWFLTKSNFHIVAVLIRFLVDPTLAALSLMVPCCLDIYFQEYTLL